MSSIPHPDREVTFTPSEFERFQHRDLSGTTCVVFDVLRATSTMLTALGNGAKEILPVATIEQAVRLKHADPLLLLAGERNGIRIRADLAGGTDFDLGNSPREFGRERVSGKRIVMTTTNGTRALQACKNAREILVGSLLNRVALGEYLAHTKPGRLLLVCSGTGEDAAMEDALGAGALADYLDQVLPANPGQKTGDGWRMASSLFESAKSDICQAISQTRNGRRLAALPDLAGDLGVCAALDQLPLVAAMNRNGEVKLIPGGR